MRCPHCGTSINAQVCTTTGCKQPVIRYTGGTLPQIGDSGGPFYARLALILPFAAIRGHHIAGNSAAGYAEPWTVVAPALGVSLG